MSKLVAAVTMLAGTAALACHHGAHGHGGNEINFRVGHLALDLRFGVRPDPCQEVVVVAQAEPQYQEQYEAAPMVEATPPPIYVAPEPEFCAPPIVEAPMPVFVAPRPPPVRVYVAPPRPVVPVPVVVAAPAVVDEPPPGPSLIALKYMPGAAANVGFKDGFEPRVEGLAFSQSAGVEVRLGRFFALRSDGELRQDGRSWDVIGAKLSLFPSSIVRPYASASLSLSDSPRLPGAIHVSVMGAGGLDIAIGRHFFIEGEIRYRRVPGCCGEEGRVTALVGAGVAFF